VIGLSLFTGYGGIDLALNEYLTGVTAYVEIEEYCQKIIANRMADGLLHRAPIFADVKNVEGETGTADIIFGGFPCQDISVAGNGKGLAGERSGLFFEIIRLTKEIRPDFVFLENVPAIRTRGLEQVIKAFTEIGYGCRWTMLSASSVGALHKRERWFLLANSTGEGLSSRRQSKLIESHAKNETGLEPKPERRRSIGLNSLMQKKHWETEPSVGRVVNGFTGRVDRIKALGNGVVPLQVKIAFELLIGMNL